MKEVMITVFTPTYNRGYKIRDLYKSLCMQTVKDFEWLIIDDGSTDDTRAIINDFITEGKITVRYYYKENGGKHTAINKAADLAVGEWIFIVDSDDYLTPDALETVLFYCNQIQEEKTCAGVVGLRGNSQGKVWSTDSLKRIRDQDTGASKSKEIENNYVDATPIDYRYKMNIQGDRAEVIRTDLLKKYKFPVFEGERFMPEAYLWYSISRDGYYFRWFNKVIYITEYLEDGLIHNGRELARKSSKSRAFVDNFCLGIPGIPLKKKMMMAINYYRYGMYSGESATHLFKKSNSKILSIPAIPIAIITRIK